MVGYHGIFEHNSSTIFGFKIEINHLSIFWRANLKVYFEGQISNF